jgi:FixJ family two-component response regulator
VLFMSGYGDAHLGEGGVLDPSIRLLTKPFSVDELTDAVARALEDARRT